MLVKLAGKEFGIVEDNRFVERFTFKKDFDMEDIESWVKSSYSRRDIKKLEKQVPFLMQVYVDMLKKKEYAKGKLGKLSNSARIVGATSFGVGFSGIFGRGFLASANGGGAGISTGLWESILPVFRVFQDVAMVVGAIAIFGGLILMLFKKTSGKKFVMNCMMIMAGCFVVPAAIMLLAIIGGMINDALIDVFRNSDLRNSVKVGG